MRQKGVVALIGIVLTIVVMVMIYVMWFSTKSIRALDLAQEDLRAYVGIVTKKGPEYATTALESGVYQGIYEVGMRGGFWEGTSAQKNISVKYGPKEMQTAVWRDYGTLSIPYSMNLERDLTKTTETIVKDTIKKYSKEYALNTSGYETAHYAVLRTKCGVEYGDDKNKRCLDANIRQVEPPIEKEYKIGGTIIANAKVAGEAGEKISIRLPGMYDLMSRFMRNNFPARAGKDLGTPYDLLSRQLEETTACPKGYNCDWDQKFSITEYCPGKDNCEQSADGYNAKFDYKCVPKLIAPACKRTIRDNIKNSIEEIETDLNKNPILPEINPSKVKCPPGVANCETEYNSGLEIYKDPDTGETYKKERFKWALKPASPNTWNNIVKWDGTSDHYNVLWWDQSPTTGECKLPDGTVFKTDNIVTLLTKPERQSTQTGIDMNPWQKSIWVYPAHVEQFPEGTACADAFYVNCHQIKRYKTTTGTAAWSSCCGGSSGVVYNGPDPTAWCEMDAYKTDPGHKPGCTSDANGAPYGGKWCSEAETTLYYTDSHSCSCSCPWTDCPSSYSDYHTYTDRGEDAHYVETAYTHCDVQYNFYGHFKYRADIDPLLVTVTDESKLIPAKDVQGKDVNVKPTFNAIYKETIKEEPHDNDRCVDKEGYEDISGSRYYHASDAGKSECPTQKNSGALRTDYYEPSQCKDCNYPDNRTDTSTQEVCVNKIWLGDAEYCTRCAPGGTCKDYATGNPVNSCADGVKDCGEKRADCGGPCNPCPTCAALSCTTTPNTCCGLAEDGIEECTQPELEPVGAACRTNCECESNTCNTGTGKCNPPAVPCPTASTPAPSFEKAITPDGCPLDLDLSFQAQSGKQFKIEAIYERGAEKIEKELCRTGGECGITSTTVPGTGSTCSMLYRYEYSGYYPWDCGTTLPSGYQLTKVKISSLDGSTISPFGLDIKADRAVKPTKCTPCGGTAYWDLASLKVSNINPGSCADNTAGGITDILDIIDCETTTGKVFGDSDHNGEIRTGELVECCDGTPPVMTLTKPASPCGSNATFAPPCTLKIRVATDEDAKCRYSEDTEAAYDGMPNTLGGSFSNVAETTLSLTNAIRTYFIGCENRIGIKTPLGSACKVKVNCTA